MPDPTYFPVTFRQDEETVFATRGYLDEIRGEPRDTARIYATALQEVKAAVRVGEVSADIYQICNITAIERPDGIVTTYTDEAMGKILDEAEALNKYRCTRDSRVVVYQTGGFTGGLLGAPINVQLDTLSEADFARTCEIADLLQSRRAELEYAKWGGDFGYYVDMGDKDATEKDLKQIFRGGPFSKTPLIVEELSRLLMPYAAKLDHRRVSFFDLLLEP